MIINILKLQYLIEYFINENTFRASSLIEMIHVATLIHDDVVDDDTRLHDGDRLALIPAVEGGKC